jgi:cell division protein FtsB
MARTRRNNSGRRLSLLTPGRAGLVVLLLAAVWVGSSFARELYLSYQNDLVAQANHEYQQQLDALSKPAGAEEQARLHSYVKPDEKVFIISGTPSPAPIPSPRAPTAAKTSPQNTDNGGFWGALWKAITGG